MLGRNTLSVDGLVKHRDLLWQFTVRNVELRHKGSHLGLVWSLLGPLLMLALYVLVFGFIFGGSFRPDRPPSPLEYGLGIFVSITVFHFVAETIGASSIIIAGNPNFVKKVVFPLEILPLASVGASAFHLLLTLGLALACVAVWGGGVSVAWLWLPVILFPLLLLASGLAWLLSALGVFLRDLNQVTPVLSMALLFASAVFYPSAQIPAAAWELLRFNPLIHAVELSRAAALWGDAPSWTRLGYLYGSGIAACLTGWFVFRSLRRAFADVL